jgi:hypothetical protein
LPLLRVIFNRKLGDYYAIHSMIEERPYALRNASMPALLRHSVSQHRIGAAVATVSQLRLALAANRAAAGLALLLPLLSGALAATSA